MGLGDFFDSVKDKTVGQVQDFGKILALPVGTAFDLVKLATPMSQDTGPDWLSAKEGASAVADTLVGEGSLTGWSITKLGETANDVYRNAIENPIETALYKGGANGDAVSWSEAWGLAKDRHLGQTSQLLTNESLNWLSDNTGGWDTSKAVRGVPLVGPVLEQAGIGAPETKDIQAADESAWDEFHKVSPFFSGSLASAVDIGAQFALDPFLLAGKATKAPRALRNLRPIQEGEEIGLATRLATEKTHKVLGVPSRKAGLQSRTDPLIGTVKYEPHVIDGKTIVDGDGAHELVAVADKAGWLDGKSPAQVYTGLQLKTHSYGDEIATLLSRTNDIKDPAGRVNTRRDILAAMGGDPAANARLAKQADSEEFAYTLSNAFRGRGTGELEFAMADDIASAAGAPKLTSVDPQVVSGVSDELRAQGGFNEWLYGSMKDRTLTTSAKGNRALARLAGQGLGRDGSLHTGFTGFDDIINDRILGRAKTGDSKLDEALDASEELAPGTPLRDAKVYEADQAQFSRGPNSQPATLSKAGLRVAQWATYARPAAKVSDALRGRTVHGSLNVEDAPLSIAVTQDFLRRANVAPEDVDRLTSAVTAAEGSTARSIAVQTAMDHATNVIADRYGVDLDLISLINTEHRARIDAATTALRGQSYTAHTKLDPATGDAVRGDVVFLPDGQSTIVLPVLDTQTINNMPLMDLDYVEKWLKRDKIIAPVGQALAKVGRNSQSKRATELGFNSRITSKLEEQSNKWVRFMAEETNSWWKRSVLLTRAPSYAIRNTSEEAMRVAAIGEAAQVADAAARHGAHRAHDRARRAGNSRYQEMAPEFAKLELRQTELDDLRALHDDPDILATVKDTKRELRSLRAKHTKALNAGDTEQAEQLRNAIEFTESMPYLAEHGGWFDEMTVLEREVTSLTKALDEKVLPDSDFRTLAGFGDTRFPDAFQGVGGRQAYDLVAGGGTFDRDVTEFGERMFSRQRGVGKQDIIDVTHPASSKGKISQHMVAWEHILNKQIRQDPAAQVAIKAMAGLDEDVPAKVLEFLSSPAAAKYVKNNPHRASDLDDWAFEISDMVKHNVHDSDLAQRLTEGSVSRAELTELFPESVSRPSVHPAGIDALVGVENRKLAQLAGRAFERIDKMSVNAVTRHPLYSVFFREEQERLAADFARKAEFELGEGATMSVDDINNLTSRARKTAQTKVRHTFYDNSSRSSAAQKLRFMYPFFAAHQDSMTFWGKAIAANPNVLRQFQLAFQVPASLGLVVDHEGNEVKPGEFVQGDHMVLLQVPKDWGGPDPKDPTAKGSGFRIPLSAANLITQNGSILNPGAGPMAAIPAAYIQRKFGATDDDLSKALEWFNPFGAPKQGGQSALPDAFGLQALDPALPTPVKRLASLWDAHHTKNSREYTEMWTLRFQEAQVKFYEENDRPPSKSEAAELEAKVDDEVKQTAWLRMMTSVLSPAQAQPYSRRQGLIDEFRRLQDQGRNENRGPFWASDTFLDMYGDAYIALTKSTSENRGRLTPAAATVKALEGNSKLVDGVAPETWRVIVGAEGEGAFSMNAYRWMQDRSVARSFGGGKAIERKDAGQWLFDVNTAAGWREYTKGKNLLEAAATQYGYPSVERSPELKAMKSELIAYLKDRFPDWYVDYSSAGVDDFESTILPSLEKIATNKSLVNDPAREDIRQLGQYIEARKAVDLLLQQRKAEGGAASLDAVANQDVAYVFATYVQELAEGNIAFSDYAIEGVISKDPFYKAGLKVLETIS